MKRDYLISGLLIISGCALVFGQNAKAQVNSTEKTSLTMTGEFSDKQATGIYVKGDNEKTVDLNWSVFVGNDGKVYKVSIVDHKITTLVIDGQQIPSENIPQFASATKPFLDYLLMQEEIDRLEKDIDANEEDIDRQEHEIDKISDRLDKTHEKLDQLEENRSVDLSAEKENISKLQERTSELRQSISVQREKFLSEREKVSSKREKIDNLDELDKVFSKIISDLKAEGIVKNEKNLSFKLSNRQLIVNGKIQSDEIFQKLKAKYVIESSYESGFLYRWKEKI